MNLLVVSHKRVWKSISQDNIWATNGGFVKQMEGLTNVFNTIEIIVPQIRNINFEGENKFKNTKIKITPIRIPEFNKLIYRRIYLMFWLIYNSFFIIKKIAQSKYIHILLPSDISMIGLFFAKVLNKKIIIRYCANWNNPKTNFQKLCKFIIKHFTRHKTVTFITGIKNNEKLKSNINWIFSTSLNQKEIHENNKRAEQKKENKEFHLITVSRLTENKNIKVVLDAISILKNQNIKLTIVGDGEQKENLINQSKKLNIDLKVNFVGQLNQQMVIEEMLQADLFCFPTKSEGFPKVIVEAFSCGLPIIIGKISNLESIIKNSGIVLEKINKESFAKAINIFMSSPKKLKSNKINAIKQSQIYSLENWIEQIKKQTKENILNSNKHIDL